MTDAPPLAREEIVFTNERGQRLAGLLECPLEPPRAYALFAHCFTCSKNVSAASRISRGLAARGFAVLRFDFTGLGNSEGDFANTNFSSNVGDVVCAARHLQAHYGRVDLLVGHSLGGTAVLAAAPELPDVRAVATVAAPSEPAHVKRLLQERLEDIARDGAATVELGGRRFTVARQFIEDIDAQRLRERVARLRKALLVMHSPLDEIVDVEEASKIFLAAKHPKSFVSLDRADHLLSDARDAQFVAEVIAAWSARYLPAPEVAATGDGIAPAEVRVRNIGGGLANEIRAGRHRWYADEPLDQGGTDRGPDPYKLLLAALGACTSMTLRLYARHKQLPLEGVAVRLRHQKIHAADCAECETKEGKLDQIEREIALQGPLDEAQRARLLEIADKCPVHRTLRSEIRILSRLAE